MKTLALSALVLLVSSQALAVRVANCPKSIVFTATKFNINKTLNDVKKDVNDDEEFDGAKVAYGYLKKNPVITVAYKLRSAASGKCEYGANDGLEDRIVLWSEGGKDRFFAQKTIGPRGTMVRLYAGLVNYSTTKLELSDYASAMLAVPRSPYTSYSAGGAMIPVGYANAVGAQVK